MLAKLKRIDPEESTTASADKMIEAKVLRKRAHAYDPKDVKKSGATIRRPNCRMASHGDSRECNGLPSLPTGAQACFIPDAWVQ